MTREQAKELLPIITAFAEGKTIQYKGKGTPDCTWQDSTLITDFRFNMHTDYRIKPEPKEFWFIWTGSWLTNSVPWFDTKEAADAYVEENPCRRVLHMREVIDE